MNESALTSACVKFLRAKMPEAVIFKHTERMMSGIPDVSVSRKNVVWLEFKAGDAIRWQNELQRLTALRLQRAAQCYVVFYRGDFTFVLYPGQIDAAGRFTDALAVRPGVNHHIVLEILRAA